LERATERDSSFSRTVLRALSEARTELTYTGHGISR
jgi:hypothetical protein